MTPDLEPQGLLPSTEKTISFSVTFGMFSSKSRLGSPPKDGREVLFLCSGHYLVLIAETEAGLLIRHPGLCVSERKIWMRRT